MPGTVLGAGFKMVRKNRAGLRVLQKYESIHLKGILLFKKKISVCKETSINLYANYFQFNPT